MVSRGGFPSNAPRAARAGRLLLAVALLAFGSGCASTRLADLRPVPNNPLAEQFKIGSWFGPKPSDRTLLVLRRTALDERIWRRLDTRPDEIITDLTRYQDADPNLETVYALAELNYIAAGRKEKKDERGSIRLYLQAIERCEQYLFDPQFDTVRNPYDPQFRGACDLYNSALERCLRFARKDGLFKAGGHVSFASVGSKLNLKIVPKGFSWNPDEFDTFEFVSDYQLKGVANKYQSHGLGVPLIAVRRRGSASPDVEKFYAKNLSFPVTAFLRLRRWDQPKSATPASETRVAEAHLELYDPLESTDIALNGLRVPLESDITTPLAYFLDTPQVRKLDIVGLLRVDKAKKFAGLYMVQPYQPGKIPVLMVHGLYSSPMTWLEAFNDLRSNPELRSRYQFWFYLYPSGQPFWESAADLREHLAQAQKTFDPHNDNAAFEDMVLVGHSMGGLVSRMVTQTSGDQYWSAISDRPFQQVKGDPDALRQFERLYFFEPVPAVRRVVTIGSPLRGSEFANDVTQRIARNLISFPKKTVEVSGKLITMNPDLFRAESATSATSIDSLDPDSPILRVLAEAPRPEGVVYNNIVGITKHDVPLEENTDGVVPYTSAHREDVESELVIRADHTHVHRDARAINELQRILKQHLREHDARRNSGILPLRGESNGEPSRNADFRMPSSSTTAPAPAGDSKPATERAAAPAAASAPAASRAAPGTIDPRLIPHSRSELIYREGSGLDDWQSATPPARAR